MTEPIATRILAIRHGETDWNVDARIQGQLNIGLNEQGLWQAQRMAQALAHETLSAVYASDLSRAWDTALPLAQAHGLSASAEPGLRERLFGVFQGLTTDEIVARWPEDSARWRQREPDFAPEGAESLLQFSDRCVRTFHALAARHAGGTIALVCHGGVLDSIYRAATGVDLQAPRTWKIANASVNRLLYTGERLTLVGWADTTHLDERERDEIADRVGPAA